jgi:hypothetical protein
MPILCNYTANEATKDSSNSTHEPAIGNKILWSMLWIFTRLNTHYSIRDNIYEGLSHSCHHKKKCNHQTIWLVKKENGDKRDELNDTHQYYVRFSIGSSNWHIITQKSVNYLNTPRNMD